MIGFDWLEAYYLRHLKGKKEQRDKLILRQHKYYEHFFKQAVFLYELIDKYYHQESD